MLNIEKSKNDKKVNRKFLIRMSYFDAGLNHNVMKNKLKTLHCCKNLNQIQKIVSQFSQQEIHFLLENLSVQNSFLFQEILDTAFHENPVLACCEKNKTYAFVFYIERKPYESYQKELEHACDFGAKEIVSIILSLDVYPSKLLKNCLENAYKNNYKDIATLLLENGA